MYCYIDAPAPVASVAQEGIAAAPPASNSHGGGEADKEARPTGLGGRGGAAEGRVFCVTTYRVGTRKDTF